MKIIQLRQIIREELQSLILERFINLFNKEDIKPEIEQYIDQLCYENTVMIWLDYDEIQKNEEWKQEFPDKFIPLYYIYYRNYYERPIITVDMRFIIPFTINKMNQIEEERRLEISEQF
jgi:hypothetical protein